MKFRIFSEQASRQGTGAGSGGFTLVELLVVIAIIGILSSVVLASLSDSRRQAEDAKRVEDMTQVRNASELYASKHEGDYPVIPVISGLPSNPASFAEAPAARPSSLLSSLVAIPALAAAAVTHTSSACKSFDSLSQMLIADSDISSEPLDPNDSPDGDCYRAWSSSDGSALVVYTSLWEKYVNALPGQPAANKQAGFVSMKGEITRAALASICTQVKTARAGDAVPTAYPIISLKLGADSVCLEDPSNQFVADKVIGYTEGSEAPVGVIAGSGAGGGGASTFSNGARCLSAGECTSARCVGGVCMAAASASSGCTHDSDCASGSCVSGQCTASAATSTANGLSCEADGDCASGHCQAGICNGLASGGDACSGPSDCASNSCSLSLCDASAASSTSATSTSSLLTLGDTCSIDGDCASGHCTSSVCNAGKSVGSSCVNSYDCASGSCVSGSCSTGSTGGSGYADGALCSADGDCSSGKCDTTLATPICNGNLPSGHSCSGNSDCASDKCSSGACYTPPVNKGIADGGICSVDNDCTSTHCIGGLCNSFEDIGIACSHGYQCSSFECDTGYCATGSSTAPGLDPAGTPCDSSSTNQCASTYCNANVCSSHPPSQANGASCTYRADCLSGTCHQGVCADPVTGCKIVGATNYDVNADVEDVTLCTFSVNCNDPAATNFNAYTSTSTDCVYAH